MKIPLHAGGKWYDPDAGEIVAWTEVDPADHAALSVHRWHLNPDGYAVRTAPRDIPRICPECGWTPLEGRKWAMSMSVHRTKKHGRRTEGKRHTIFMHRLVLGLERGDRRQGDHVNRNRLDNHRSNLRIVPGRWQVQNQGSPRTFNGKPVESPYRGVLKIKKNGVWTGKWKAMVSQKYLGSFATEEEAAEAARQYRMQTMPYALD